MIPEKLITYDQAAARYYCSKKTLERAIKGGRIDAYKAGHNVMIDQDSGDEWFASRKIKPVRAQGRPRSKVVVNMPRTAQCG